MLQNNQSLASRTLRVAVLRIGLVALFASAVSYFLNESSIENSVRQQLILSTEQTLQRESLPFKEIKDLQRNFLDEFKVLDSEPGQKQKLARDFDQIFYRHDDGSYTQRPGLFEGQALPDGRRFANMSATYAPEIVPDTDIKARFTLSYVLSYKYGSSAKGRLFNFYGVLPEKGFPIYQAADIAKVFTYTGLDALKLGTFEFYYQGFGSPAHDTIFTRMYWDASNAAWMTTIATPDVADAKEKHRILACVDVLLDDLMRHTAKPSIQGAYSTIFLPDSEGTLIYHPDFTDELKQSEGHASIKSLDIKNDFPLLGQVQALTPGKASLIETDRDLIAFGIIPETPWVLTVHYPKSLMQPAILQNLGIVLALGILTLLVEVFIIRSILLNQVATPLSRLISAARQLGQSGKRLDSSDLPTRSQDEIGELAREFASMAERTQNVRQQLEAKVQEHSAALDEANRKLIALKITDDLTGIANHRRFDEALADEWRRAQRAESRLTLMMIDVDWFKPYNDHYGHQAGDECLRHIARILEPRVRRAGDVVARYGGGKFAIIVAMADAGNAQLFAQAICDTLEQTAMPHDLSPFGYVTVSIGVATIVPAADKTAEELIRTADSALYRAKNMGRNQVCMAE